jgi:tRNA G18 (ribose-2'-O)-methylase SpoU
LNILLCGLQSPINCGMILRSAEAYGHTVTIHDSFGIFSDRQKSETVSDFACGALQRHPPVMLDDLMEHLKSAQARIIATAIAGDTHVAHSFKWRPDDIVLVGNEYDGLDSGLVDMSDCRVRIQMPPGHLPKPKSFQPIDRQRHKDVNNNGAPNLNTAVATSIICYLSYLRSSGTDCGASSE